MEESFAQELAAKRNCWIAQTDLWQPIIREINVLMKSESSEPLLPCADGKCRFKIDNDLRKAGKDPSPQCPRAAKIERTKIVNLSPLFTYAAKRPDFNFWTKEIQDVKL
jgi:hypothetical protein